MSKVVIDAINDIYPKDVDAGPNMTINYDGSENGEVTAGMITIQAAPPGSDIFSPISGIDPIDISAPVPQTIIGTVADKLEFTLSGVSADSGAKIILITTAWA